MAASTAVQNHFYIMLFSCQLPCCVIFSPPVALQDVYLEIEEQGESGARVLFGMKDRLQRTLDEHTTAGRLYDWVLLLAGINDLAGDWECCRSSSQRPHQQCGCVLQCRAQATALIKKMLQMLVQGAGIDIDCAGRSSRGQSNSI